ncbi:hypothetical protein B0H11DRAFT_1707742 [Mycena galericulata]|nr:hypothetical protein B0H11DRAFT_1707742 [Mycena galericulata]
MSGSPFEIATTDATIHRLHQKLELTTIPDELDDAGWEYGVPLADVKYPWDDDEGDIPI